MFMRLSARMSLDLERILGNERLLRAVTSLSRAEFDRLLSAFEALWEKEAQAAQLRRGAPPESCGSRQPGPSALGCAQASLHPFLFQVPSPAGGSGASLRL